MIYRLPESIQWTEESFTNPFRYAPHPLVKEAAGQVMTMLESWKTQPEGSPYRELERSFAEGKMLGVLLVYPYPSKVSTKSPDDSHIILNEGRNLHYIAAFSGTVRGADGLVTATVEGFVPPIIDLTAPDGYFKIKETEISQLNLKIAELSNSPLLQNLKHNLNKAESERDAELDDMQAKIRCAKKRRDEVRQEVVDQNTWDELIRESQFQKAELKRHKDKWKDKIASIQSELSLVEEEIRRLKALRSQKSDDLQKWIFENAEVHNATGESSTICKIFDSNGLTPPGGTGDCAAPKLLEYAFKHGLRPLAMGEFWYGKSPDTAVRTHGHFYPSCTSKCGPLLGYMTQGLSSPASIGVPQPSESFIFSEDTEQSISSHKNTETTCISSTAIKELPIIIYEDDSIIVVEKPSGMPSIPGLDGGTSLQEWLSEQYQSIHTVHRLDMDTSGVMLFAKTTKAAVNLRRQFEEHTVHKTYMARVSPTHRFHPGLHWEGISVEAEINKGLPAEPGTRKSRSIDLPLSPDYDERPRQKVDFKQGKEAHTEYEFVKEYADGTADMLLYPHTGRTHQLRIHCAHTLGLARPILGDLLYGAHTIDICKGDCPKSAVQGQVQVPTRPCPESGYTHPSRLCLHALRITFRHPDTYSTLTFTSSRLAY